MAKGNPYSERHRQERQEKLESMSERKCEITGQKKHLSAHHQVPKLFSGPDMKENYLILSRAFHEYLHSICNVDNPELVSKRLYLADYIKKHILDDNKREDAVRKLDEIDSILMPEYIDNLINILAKDFHDIIFHTIYSNFQTIKHQAIQIHHLEAKNKAINS